MALEDRDMLDLIELYLDGEHDAEQLAELSAWLNQSRANRDVFARVATVHRQYRDWATAQSDLHQIDATLMDQDESRRIDEEVWQSVLDDAVAAKRRAEIEDKASHLFSENIQNERLSFEAAHSASKAKQPRVIVISRPLFFGAIAAMLLVGAFIATQFVGQDPPVVPGTANSEQIKPVEPNVPALPRVAVLQAADGCTWSVGQGLSVGEPAVTREYQLIRGLATLRFDGGAMVRVEAPARFTLDDARGMTLHDGRIVGFCDESARGFVVRPPHAELVDLGTDFGVVVDPWKETQLHVFTGQVQASMLDHQGRPTQPRVVNKDQAVSAAADAQFISLLSQAQADLFETTRRIEIPLANTGEQVRDADGVDLNWRVVAVNGQPLPEPIASVLHDPSAHLRRGFRANRADVSWIIADPRADLANQDSYTFATEFQLADHIDPQTLQLTLGYVADNYVAEIRLNGQAISAPRPLTYDSFTALTQTSVQRGFVAGANRLEIIISNILPTRPDPTRRRRRQPQPPRAHGRAGPHRPAAVEDRGFGRGAKPLNTPACHTRVRGSCRHIPTTQ